MLTAHALEKSYGLTPVLRDVTFSVNQDDRIGLIGPNGAGKSTLLRILAGREQPGSGHITRTPPDLRVGYLAQGFEPPPNHTIADVLHTAVGDPARLDEEIARLATALASNPNDSDLQAAYDGALRRLDAAGSGDVPATLAALGLADLDLNQRAATLSGGQKTRLALALILLSDPRLLLLDEPTNHLDIAMLEWLEAWLHEFRGGVLIVSHDRTFLDRTVTRVLDLNAETQTIREYAGNYSQYLDQYLAAQERQLAAYKDQVAEIRRLRQDIVRTREQALGVERSTTPRQPNIRRYAKKVAKKAAAREKKLERYLASEERVEKPKQGWQLKLDFDAPHLGQDVLYLEELAVGYQPASPLLGNLNLQVRAGQRIAFTGPNGAGKTTLLRTIAGLLPPLHGRYRLGASVRLGYLAQQQETLNPDQTPLQTIQGVAPLNETDARSFLHYFLFTDDEPLRLNAKLSFGERARLGLALLVAQGCNFLLLDEPINHLDIPARERFEQALSGFDGTVLAVVHDRYFIRRFATVLWTAVGNKIEVAL